MEIQVNGKPATTPEAITAINRAIAHHEKYSRLGTCAPGNAYGRRAMEKNAEYRVEITIDGNEYVFDAYASVSCRWVRYSGYFGINGVKKDVRLFKGLLKTLAQ